jgi:PKD repeat protein
LRRGLALVAALVGLLAWSSVAAAAPSALATAAPTAGSPLTFDFDASASTADAGRTITGYAWNFGDGTSGSGAVVSHTYPAPGSYTARVTVTDDRGDTGTTSLTVTARKITLALPAGVLEYGRPAAVSGMLVAAGEGATIVLELDAGSGWETLATVLTDAAGAFSASFSARPGTLRARAAATGATSVEHTLAVGPRVTLHRAAGRAFLGARLTAEIEPASYSGTVSIRVMRWSRVLARSRATVSGGRLVTRVATPGLGAFRVRVAFPAAAGLAARTVSTRVTSRARTLRMGSGGRDVRALHRRLAQLRIHIPGLNYGYSRATFDSVVAFQKAFGLPRTGVVGSQTWYWLGRARPVRARYSRPYLHIEVDKSRQILMMVRNGVPRVIPVSTGATGNTPVGAFRILWKAPATGTWLGSAILWRTLTFHGGFAIHGFSPVPVWPASHGCVRVPMWIANWLYVRSPVGERVFIYP